MQSLNISDIEVLTIAALVLALQQAVHSQVLASTNGPTPEYWVSAISSFLKAHDEHIQEWVHNIRLQIGAIVDEMKHKDIISWQLNIGQAWRFSEKDTQIFATKLEECIDANPI
ncbi:hypothetical protein B0H11DRAFT_2025820 [Mycena galericulata]|nr:hypothetical protein B0H11DRAFT_2025820 [Mycena galericulata]